MVFPVKKHWFIFAGLIGIVVGCLSLAPSHWLLKITHQASLWHVAVVQALDPVDELQREIDELEKLKKLSEDATTPLEQQLKNLEVRINTARAGIVTAQKEVEVLSDSINQRESELLEHTTILYQRVHEQYKTQRRMQMVISFFSAKDLTHLVKDVAYHFAVREQDKHIIETTGAEIVKLEQDKKALEERQVVLAKLQTQLDAQAVFFKAEIEKAREYQKELKGKIADLSAQQKAIINARSGGSTITAVGDVPLADDFNASIGFKAQAPANSFAVFSFGGYTHRNGMSQYGAKARADAGQSAEEILKAYYPDAQLKKEYPAMGSISVQGVGTISFEDHYLQGIYEMPGGWHKEALKAQAIAARTYAIRHTNNGATSICTTEACQVFKNSKKGGAWEEAVNETKGWVLVDGSGNPVSTQYASTHGGYARTSGWDTEDKTGNGNWSSRAWESKAGSPWFYKSWYRTGYSSSGNSCGRSHPWLSQEEFADIINAWIVRNNSTEADQSRILPITIGSCSISGGGGNPYSMTELRELADRAGGAVKQVSGVTVSHTASAQTAQVKIQTNRGEVTLSGTEFKDVYNLRAPGYLRIPQNSFAFFNIEHKQ